MRCFLLLFVIACGRNDSPGTADTTTPASVETAQPTNAPITLTQADIDGFVKGITNEARLVREGQERAGKAVTPVERGNAIQSTFEENTMSNSVAASGLSLERYRMVRQTLSRLLTTLDFQGKIDGPQSVDTALANDEMKARLASDPYSALDPASAQLVKANLDRISQPWIDYVTLTAVSG